MKRIGLMLVAGALALSLTAVALAATPPNDDIEDAQVLGSSWSLTTPTTEATLQAGEPLQCGNNLHNTVWYEFTPSRDGRVTVSRNGGGVETAILVVRTNVVIDRDIQGGIDPVDFGDKYKCAYLTQGAATSFTVEGGETYYYQVGLQNSERGGAKLSGSFR